MRNDHIFHRDLQIFGRATARLDVATGTIHTEGGGFQLLPRPTRFHDVIGRIIVELRKR